MLPRRHRLTSGQDFRSVLRGRGDGRRRRRAGTSLLVVHASCPAPDDGSTRCPRVGFVVSRAVGNAVVRNRTARRLRALVGARLATMPCGTDLVVRALPPAASATSTELGSALDDGLARALPRLV